MQQPKKTSKRALDFTESSTLDGASLVYTYDGSLEGLLTAVFQAYVNKENPQNIIADENLQESLLYSYCPITTDLAKAERVKNGILRALNEESYDNILRAYLSDNMLKGGVILRYLRYAIKIGPKANKHLANPAVAALINILREVSSEVHYFLQFARFAQTTSGVYYSRIEPKANIIPLITEHFAYRFNIQPFVIYDPVHALASVFNTERWWLADAHDICLPGFTTMTDSEEDDFQLLWQTFYDTIAIKERRNPNCQRNFMPKRFWGNMCEHIPPELRKHRPKTITPTQAAQAKEAQLEAARTQMMRMAATTTHKSAQPCSPPDRQ